MKLLVLAALCACLSAASISAQIYADFTTSLGNFTCELNHTAAPKTVANFVGLADGTRAWVDPASGAIRESTPYYDGLIFHRVIAGFMNQGGCPLGTGMEGPGYAFPDETSNGLTHLPYVISMANSGTNTNGSQFFITVSNRPNLNGVHTVFGSVVSGTAVVNQINAVPTGASDRPVTPVVIQHIAIRRVGAAAQAFNVDGWNLPEVSNIRASLQVDLASSVYAVPETPRRGGTVTTIHRTADLLSWQSTYSHFLGTGPSTRVAFGVDLPPGEGTTLPPKGFYRFSHAYHPDAIVPQSMASRTLRVNIGGNYYEFSINAQGTGGTVYYSLDNTTRPITRIHPTYSPYEWVFDVTGWGSRKVSAYLTGETTTLNGPHQYYQWNSLAGWVLIGSGTFTLSK